MTTTCQVCARPIKAKSGRIAHHGYRRPWFRSGVQTSSCCGAKELPYEVSCEFLALVLGNVRAQLVKAISEEKQFTADPPMVLEFQERDSWGNKVGALRTYTRPDGFVNDGVRGQFGRGPYGYRYHAELRNRTGLVSSLEQEAAFLATRLADWTGVSK